MPAIPQSIRANAFITASGIVRAEGPDLSVREAASRIVQRYFDNDASYNLYAITVVKQAQRAAAAAREYEPETGSQAPAQNLPTDPYVTSQGSRYGYRVLITTTRLDTLKEFSTATYVLSETPLSYDQIASRAIEMFRANDLQHDYRTVIDNVSPVTPIEVTVLSAGRG